MGDLEHVHQEFSPFPHVSPTWVTSVRVATDAIEGWNFGDVLAALGPYLVGELGVIASMTWAAARRWPKDKTVGT